MSVELALKVAEKAHRGQKRHRAAFSVLTSSGVRHKPSENEPYILHPTRVALAVASKLGHIVDQWREHRVTQVALLHDVVEDSKVTLDDLRSAGFSDAVVNDVALLTRDIEVSYFDYIERISEGPLPAVCVKVHDLLDNLDGFTVDGVFADHSMVKRYRKALALLSWSGREAKL